MYLMFKLSVSYNAKNYAKSVVSKHSGLRQTANLPNWTGKLLHRLCAKRCRITLVKFAVILFIITSTEQKVLQMSYFKNGYTDNFYTRHTQATSTSRNWAGRPRTLSGSQVESLQEKYLKFRSCSGSVVATRCCQFVSSIFFYVSLEQHQLISTQICIQWKSMVSPV